MLKEIDWPPNLQYRSNSDREPFEFFLNAFSESTAADILLGYFSFSAIHTLSLGFAQFIANGGKLRIVANHILSKQDKETLLAAEAAGDQSQLIDLYNLAKLKDTLDEYGKHFFECMAYLVARKRIEIVIIKPIGKNGISHYKSGVFSKGEDRLSFQSSCNFTAYGLLENLESLSVELDWQSETSYLRVCSQEELFRSYFEKFDDSVEYLPVHEIEIAVRDHFGGKELDELLVDEEKLISLQGKVKENPKIKRLISSLNKKVEEEKYKPRFPYPEGPRAYQKEAYEKWIENGFQGIFAMATGTGKTITSLNCVLNEYKKSSNRTYHAFILVPTITLVEQWSEEARGFNYPDIITVSSKVKWESQLATTLSTVKRVPTSFIIIGTYASFIRDRFHKYAKQLPDDTIFIADEAHNIGSKSVLQRLKEVTLNKRIGLSATPKRIYDPEGSAAMEQFFNDQEPYTYAFSMEKAITDGILCQYDYHPHLVELTSEELREYAEITKKLARLYVPSSSSFTKDEIAQRLLLKRKRIIHKAANKLPKTLEILNKRYREEGHLKFTFIYVPEGFATNIEDVDNVDETDEENLRIINEYTSAIGRIDYNILVNQFVSGMADRDEVLEQFKNGQIQVIASMKCLDEGVDIPRAEHAIFCSSTGNPRQFIQRRGRILRKHPEKHKATIHDLVVIPNLSLSEKDSETFNLEKSLVKKEIERVMYFASLAQNPFETEALFEEICNHYDLNIYTIFEELKGT